MSEQKFPPGWDEDRVRKVLAHYDAQTEDEAVAEDEAGVRPGETVMNVPRARAGEPVHTRPQKSASSLAP